VSLKLDPNEKDPYLLWAEIARLNAALQGPKGYATWQDAAVHERQMRVAAQKARGELPVLSEGAVMHAVTQATVERWEAGDKTGDIQQWDAKRDKSLWLAFAERLRLQWNSML
jgi:hypothetical protein